MTPVIHLARNNISPSVRRYAAEFKLGLRVVVKQTAKGITRRVIDITPPSNGGNTGADAYRAGRNKIANQMGAVMAPVRLKGRRLIKQAWGRPLKRPRYVPTKERHPDVAGDYAARLRSKSGGLGLATTRGQKLYVDVRKFKEVLRARQERVGTLASGWAAAAVALDVPVQQWINRHGGSRGMVRIDTAGDRMFVTVENFAPGLPGPVQAELARRIPSAVQLQANAMERAINGYHQRVKGQLNIK